VLIVPLPGRCAQTLSGCLRITRHVHPHGGPDHALRHFPRPSFARGRLCLCVCLCVVSRPTQGPPDLASVSALLAVLALIRFPLLQSQRISDARRGTFTLLMVTSVDSEVLRARLTVSARGHGLHMSSVMSPSDLHIAFRSSQREQPVIQQQTRARGDAPDPGKAGGAPGAHYSRCPLRPGGRSE
jgi:hypothetical protein